MTVAAVLGRIEDIQQRIRSLSTGASAPIGAAAAADGAASASASAFADAVREVGRLVEGGEVTGADVVERAKAYLGVPYVFGGEDASGMDCSGLVQRVFADLGIELPRVVKDQADVGVEVPSLADARPGDLLVTKDEGHIVIYAGDGMVIHAPSPGKVVELRGNWLKDADLSTIRRIVPVEQPPAAAMATAGGQSAAPAVAAVAMGALALPVAARAGLTAGAVPAAAAPGAVPATPSAAAASAAPGPVPFAPSTAAPVQDPLRARITTTDPATPLAAASITAPTSAPEEAPAPAPTAPAARATPAAQLTAPVLSLVQKGDGEHTVTVRITPDTLGPITVKAQISGGAVVIELLTEAGAGRDALRAMLVDLRRDLAGLLPQANLTLGAGDTTRSDAGGPGSAWSGGATGGQSSSGDAGTGRPARDQASPASDDRHAPGGALDPRHPDRSPVGAAAGIDLFA